MLMKMENAEFQWGGEYSRPEIAEVNLPVEEGFCMSSQLCDFEENRIYTEDF